MRTIEIEWTSDSWDCETCGMSYAEGAIVTIDGEPFGNFEALAHCYGGSNHAQEDVLRAILSHLATVTEKNGYT